MLKDPVVQQCRLRRDAGEGDGEENVDANGFITAVNDKKNVPQVCMNIVSYLYHDNLMLKSFQLEYKCQPKLLIFLHFFRWFVQFGANVPKPTSGTSGDSQSAAGADAPPGESKEGEPVPEDITTFYDKIDKEEEDEDEAVLKTVSFEVNQVQVLFK